MRAPSHSYPCPPRAPRAPRAPQEGSLGGRLERLAEPYYAAMLPHHVTRQADGTFPAQDATSPDRTFPAGGDALGGTSASLGAVLNPRGQNGAQMGAAVPFDGSLGLMSDPSTLRDFGVSSGSWDGGPFDLHGRLVDASLNGGLVTSNNRDQLVSSNNQRTGQGGQDAAPGSAAQGAAFGGGALGLLSGVVPGNVGGQGMVAGGAGEAVQTSRTALPISASPFSTPASPTPSSSSSFDVAALIARLRARDLMTHGSTHAQGPSAQGSSSAGSSSVSNWFGGKGAVSTGNEGGEEEAVWGGMAGGMAGVGAWRTGGARTGGGVSGSGGVLGSRGRATAAAQRGFGSPLHAPSSQGQAAQAGLGVPSSTDKLAAGGVAAAAGGGGAGGGGGGGGGGEGGAVSESSPTSARPSSALFLGPRVVISSPSKKHAHGHKHGGGSHHSHAGKPVHRKPRVPRGQIGLIDNVPPFDGTITFSKRSAPPVGSKIETIWTIPSHRGSGVRSLGLMTQELYDMLPDTDILGSMRFGSCAVVGSAGILVTQPFGAEIDAHDAVIRFNIAPVTGFERFVGSRTTIRLVNRKHIGFREGTNDRFVLQHVTNDESFQAYQRVVAKQPPDQRTTYMVDQAFYGLVVTKDMLQPTNGYFGLRLALLLCERVSIYGFVRQWQGWFSYHYFNDEEPNHLQVPRDSSELPVIQKLIAENADRVRFMHPCVLDATCQGCSSATYCDGKAPFPLPRPGHCRVNGTGCFIACPNQLPAGITMLPEAAAASAAAAESCAVGVMGHCAQVFEQGTHPCIP
eukprot:jgi/Mesvir1/7958/Mv11871-RA.4